MSKTIASESNEYDKSQEMCGKRGAKDEGDENEEEFIKVPPEESLPISTVVSTAPPSWITKLRKPELRAELNDRSVKYEKKDNKSVLVELLRLRLRCEVLLSGNNFLNTDDFRRLLVPFLPNDMLATTRLASKPWSRVADAFIGDGVESGVMIVRGEGEEHLQGGVPVFKERHKLVTRVVFLLNITKVRMVACFWAVNLVVVDIPEGIESITYAAFGCCHSLTTVSFPTTLTSIGNSAFSNCRNLENVDLLHTNLQKLGEHAFLGCWELKSMTIPDSLQTLGDAVFCFCSKLVPSNISTRDSDSNLVVAHLRSQQQEQE
ncbi:hypothetical protein TL16_g10478 [Triparma laevis f. inornata]|uniref:Uncharacterized protein n=1 Tax=Triparma laevis f. inornata TaxID=1714386 RepID=A0A9W7EQG0_9STRA|nr:hypothetical protein TL16_g10478 [Triparma laevis f. inornata]